MSDLRKVQIATILNSARFWIIAFILYLGERGIPADTAFLLMGFYYVLTLLLEYPTGVIGDYYSHRTSVAIGFLLLAACFWLFTLPGPLGYYIGVTCLLALASSLISGSDTALFHAVAQNFREQYANVSSLSVIAGFLAVTIGGLLAAWDLRYPLYLTAFSYLIAGFLVASLREYRYTRGSADLVLASKAAFRYVFSRDQRRLFFTILLAAVLGGIFYDFKWLINPMFVEAGLPLALWGVIAGTAVLCIGLGTKATTWYPHLSWGWGILGVGLGLALTGLLQWLPLLFLGLIISHFFRGYMETSYMIAVNEEISGQIRSSVLSLQSVVLRTGAALFLGIGSIAIGHSSVGWLMIGTAAVFIILSLFFAQRLRQHENRVYQE